jgi:hypothetical protein
MELPDDEDLTIVAIEVEEVLTFSEECTSAVQESIPRAVEVVLAELDRVGAGRLNGRAEAGDAST